MRKIGIISAFGGELKPLVEEWRPFDLRQFGAGRRKQDGQGGQAAWQGRIGGAECIAVAGGMGNDRAARACDIAESALGGLDALVSMGWAGALSCGVHAGQAYVVEEVVEADTGERFSAGLSPPAGSTVKLLTIDHVAESKEKRQLAERHSAVLVDMEGAAVARKAKANGIGFYCFKAVSDAYGELLPSFSRYSDAQGQIRIPALLVHTAFRPKYWPAMARLRKNTKTGAVALAAAIGDFLERYGNDSEP